MKIVLIACGGAFGSVLRYLVGGAVQRLMAGTTDRPPGEVLPAGTLAVNLIGCLLIGVLAALFNRNVLPSDQYRLALTVGVLGGFTTFSAFGLDTLTLLQRNHLTLAIVNIGANVVGGLLAVQVGFWLVGLWRPQDI